MGIIKELDNRFNEKLGYKQQWVLFECPLCGKQEEKTKMLASSIENCKTCGNKVASLKRTKHGGAGRNKEEPFKRSEKSYHNPNLCHNDNPNTLIYTFH